MTRIEIPSRGEFRQFVFYTDLRLHGTKIYTECSKLSVIIPETSRLLKAITVCGSLTVKLRLNCVLLKILHCIFAENLVHKTCLHGKWFKIYHMRNFVRCFCRILYVCSSPSLNSLFLIPALQCRRITHQGHRLRITFIVY